MRAPCGHARQHGSKKQQTSQDKRHQPILQEFDADYAQGFCGVDARVFC
jgi:hypothetical protein